jgi:hypothetical protein
VKTARSDVRTTATGEFSCTADVFTYDLRLVVREDGRVLHRDRWRGSIPRRSC